MLYFAAFALLVIAATSASNGESGVFTINQENNKIEEYLREYVRGQAAYENIPVIVVLKEQPAHEVSSRVKQEFRKQFKAIEKPAEKIYSRIKPLKGNEEKLRTKDFAELIAIEQSLLTEQEKSSLNETGRNLESKVREMRREILARTVPLADKTQRSIIDKINTRGGRVKYSSKIFNMIAADIPVSYIEELSQEHGVRKIHYDHVLNEDLDTSGRAMSANTFWSTGYTGINADAAIIDTGIDGSHPALSVDYAGVFHDTAKTDSNYSDDPTSTDDLRGHGTHIAGIVAGNNSTYKGIAYGIDKLINAKAGWLGKDGTGHMYESDVMKAIDWALFGNPDDADVISYSFGNDTESTTSGDSAFEHFMDAVVYELDTPVVKSAGNNGSKSGTITDPGGAFNVITVGDVDDRNTISRADDLLRYSSSRGPTPDGRIKPDISAPGTNIMSANGNWESEADFISKTGTSMAAPHITGSILLLLNYKYYQPEAIKALLLNTAEDKGTAGPDNDYGFGYVDLSHAYIHRDDVLTGSVEDLQDGSVEKFFKGNATSGDKATLVWNRHVDYTNSSYPESYLNISNLDLYMYDGNSGDLISSSTSDVNNVEQVRSNADNTSVVLKIEPYGTFPKGISLEDYALATEEGFTETSPPSLNINVSNPGNVASGANFEIIAAITNKGDIAAHNVSVTVSLPSGFTMISGANPQLSGTINTGDLEKATWIVQAPELVDISTSYTLEVSANSRSYGESYSSNNTSTITVSSSGITAHMPDIIGFAPPSPVSSIAGYARTFNMTFNQIVNVTWRINGTPVQLYENKLSADYTNTSAASGTWIVNADATNAKGAISKEWIWNVISPFMMTITSPTNNSQESTGNINVTVKLNRDGTAILNWNGMNESMDGAGTTFYKNKTGLLSGKYSFKVYANDSNGISNVSETRIVRVNRAASTSLTPYINTSSFIVNTTINIISPEGNAVVIVPNGTLAAVNGSHMPYISIDTLAEINPSFTVSLGSNERLVGENLSLSPSGAVFSPGIQIRFNYTDALITAVDVSERDLKVKYYNTSESIWEALSVYERSTVENYLIVNLSHFGIFSLIGMVPTTTATTATGTSTGGSGGGGGGGGGGASAENFLNVIVREKYDEEIFKDRVTSYKFKNAGNPIIHVNVTGNLNAGLITAMIEVLKGTSILVKEAPPGIVNKNANLWLGTSGFATPRNLKEVVIRFRVENGWMQHNNVDARDVKLLRWDGAGWIALETKAKEKDATNTYFEATTDSLSPLAISGVAPPPGGPVAGRLSEESQPRPVEIQRSTPAPKGIPGFEIVAAISVLAVIYMMGKRYEAGLLKLRKK